MKQVGLSLLFHLTPEAFGTVLLFLNVLLFLSVLQIPFPHHSKFCRIFLCFWCSMLVLKMKNVETGKSSRQHLVQVSFAVPPPTFITLNFCLPLQRHDHTGIKNSLSSVVGAKAKDLLGWIIKYRRWNKGVLRKCGHLENQRKRDSS